jgi:hypothetical protein
MTMKRLNFHLTDDQIQRLYAMATQRHVSAGELVRRFIDQGLARLGSPSDMGEGSDLAVLQQQVATMREELHMLRIRLERQEEHLLS